MQWQTGMPPIIYGAWIHRRIWWSGVVGEIDSWHLVNQPMLQQGWDTIAVFNVRSDGHVRMSTSQ